MVFSSVLNFLSLSAAMFSVPTTVNVTVGGSLKLCVVMTTTPPQGTTANEVIVSLTANDTSKDECVVD